MSNKIRNQDLCTARHSKKDEFYTQLSDIEKELKHYRPHFKERHEDLILYKTHSPEAYPKYNNYDAIEVSKTKEIPADYYEAMGVPITFRDKYNPMINIGIIGVFNPPEKGLSILNKFIKEFLEKYINDAQVNLFEIPGGSAAHQVDKTFSQNKNLQNFILNQDFIISVELFFPNIFSNCNWQNTKIIWIPMHEWIPTDKLTTDLFSIVDYIVTPQKSCADFLVSKFKLTNVYDCPWILDLPIFKKGPNKDKTTILFNAGKHGVGDRRNVDLVCQTMVEILNEYKPIEFIFKTQKSYCYSKLFKYNNFHYHEGNWNYKTNLGLYKLADFSLAPSKWEGIGFSILESLYCGTPVITTDAPPMNEWISHNKTGYLCNVQYADVKTTLSLTGERKQGIGWVRAANISKEELKRQIYHAITNKDMIYKNFNKKNQRTLNNRKKEFIKIWRSILK